MGSLSCSSLFGQADDVTDLSYAIVASKKGVERKYKSGSRLLIKYSNGHSAQKARGYFAGVEDGKIMMLSKKSARVYPSISPDSILLIRRIRPTQRIIFAAAGLTLIGTGTVVLDNASNSSGISGAAVLVIPVIGAGVYFLYAVPISLLIEKLNEKKKIKGWTYSIERLK